MLDRYRGFSVRLMLLVLATSSSYQLEANAGSKILISALTPPSQLSVERTVDGTSFIQDMSDAAGQLNGYSFKYATTVFKGSKTINQQGLFYFKAPRQIRVEMTGDYKRGAICVIQKDGKIRGHLGGALSAFTINISASSDLLQGANGYPLTDSDFSSMAAVMKKFIAQGSKCRVSEHPVAVEGQTKKVYVVEFYRGTELFKRAYIDPQSLLPVEWFDYQNGRLFADTVWNSFKQDPNLNDDLFKL